MVTRPLLAVKEGQAPGDVGQRRGPSLPLRVPSQSARDSIRYTLEGSRMEDFAGSGLECPDAGSENEMCFLLPDLARLGCA